MLNSLFSTSNFSASCFTADSYRFRMTRNSCALSKGLVCVLSMIRTVRSVLLFPKNRTYSTSVLQVLFSGYFFNESLNVLPALKAGTVEAGMSIVAPVAGLCPVRAGLLRDSNVPKPVNRTESPFTTASVIAASSESMTAAVSFLDTPALAETASTISYLVIFRDLLSRIAFLLNRSCRISKYIISYICDFFYCFCFNSPLGREKHGFLKKKR